jgi:hypothetical protein
MRVVQPYTHVDERVREALLAAFPANAKFNGLGFVDVADADTAYWQLLHSLWAEGETFCIVEHDVIVREDTIGELAACPDEWCAFEILIYNGIPWAGLGCMKFGSTLIEQVPDLLDAISTLSDHSHPRKHWCRLDAWIQNHLHAFGHKQHVHRPPLEHVRAPGQPAGPSHAACRGA